METKFDLQTKNRFSSFSYKNNTKLLKGKNENSTVKKNKGSITKKKRVSNAKNNKVQNKLNFETFNKSFNNSFGNKDDVIIIDEEGNKDWSNNMENSKDDVMIIDEEGKYNKGCINKIENNKDAPKCTTATPTITSIIHNFNNDNFTTNNNNNNYSFNNSNKTYIDHDNSIENDNSINMNNNSDNSFDNNITFRNKGDSKNQNHSNRNRNDNHKVSKVSTNNANSQVFHRQNSVAENNKKHTHLYEQIRGMIYAFQVSESRAVQRITKSYLQRCLKWAEFAEELYTKSSNYRELRQIIVSTFFRVLNSIKPELKNLTCVQQLKNARILMLKTLIKNENFPIAFRNVLIASNRKWNLSLDDEIKTSFCEEMICQAKFQLLESASESVLSPYTRDLIYRKQIAFWLVHKLKLHYDINKELDLAFLINLKCFLLKNPESLVTIVMVLDCEEKAENHTFYILYCEWVCKIIENDMLQPEIFLDHEENVRMCVDLSGRFVIFAKVCMGYLVDLMDKFTHLSVDNTTQSRDILLVTTYWRALQRKGQNLKWAVNQILEDYLNNRCSSLVIFWKKILQEKQILSI